MFEGKRIFVTGSRGFLGQHVVRHLMAKQAEVLINFGDLTNLNTCFLPSDIDLVVHLAADVKGISANSKLPHRFLHRNTLMALNIIELCREAGNIPLVAAGSVCAYPANAPLPFNETNLWDGKAEKSNYGYGLAKRFLAGALECAAMEYGLRYVHLISANLYGPGDHFGDSEGHVIPALIKRIAEAKICNDPGVGIWGTGLATRDFLYVEDAARAYVRAAEYLLEGGESLECNIGSGDEQSIYAIAHLISDLLGYTGALHFDSSKPDGQMRRLLDVNKSDELLGWFNTTSMGRGLRQTIEWYKETVNG